MEDTIVSFEIAKLLKEKGYTDIVGIIKGKHYYNYKGEVDGDQLDFIKASLRKENLTLVENYPAPTLSLAQKWLREVHNLEINIQSDMLGYYMFLVNRDKLLRVKVEGNNIFQTYELALEEGIKQALNLIK